MHVNRAMFYISELTLERRPSYSINSPMRPFIWQLLMVSQLLLVKMTWNPCTVSCIPSVISGISQSTVTSFHWKSQMHPKGKPVNIWAFAGDANLLAEIYWPPSHLEGSSWSPWEFSHGRENPCTATEGQILLPRKGGNVTSLMLFHYLRMRIANSMYHVWTYICMMNVHFQHYGLL